METSRGTGIGKDLDSTLVVAAKARRYAGFRGIGSSSQAKFLPWRHE